ncbi:MAG TPA: flavodoxin family protein [Methanomassiliicoccales archaeon]|jgi:multimeric flavodoxin WrbA
MYMKVLAIMGSPKGNGNGFEVTKAIEGHMNARGRVEFDYLMLKDVNLGLCRGCFQCISKGEDRCPMREDRLAIERRMEDADGIILVSPGYVQDVSWLMKNFIDRFAYTHHRPKYFEKKVMLVANGGSGLKRTTKSLSMAIGGLEIVSELQAMKLPWPMNDRAIRKNQQRIEKAADRFYDELQRKEPRVSLGSYMGFRFFKSVSESTREHLPADYEYYRDKTDYYFPAKIGLGKRGGSALLIAILKRTMRDMTPRED